MSEIEEMYEFLGLEMPNNHRKIIGVDPVSPESDKNRLKDFSLDSVDENPKVEENPAKNGHKNDEIISRHSTESHLSDKNYSEYINNWSAWRLSIIADLESSDDDSTHFSDDRNDFDTRWSKNELNLLMKKGCLIDEEGGKVVIKKPKFAENLREAKKLMKIRRKMKKEEIRRQPSLEMEKNLESRSNSLDESSARKIFEHREEKEEETAEVRSYGEIVSSVSKTMALPKLKRKYSTTFLTDIPLNNNNAEKKTTNVDVDEGNIAKKRKIGRPRKEKSNPSLCSQQNLLNGEWSSNQRYERDDLYKPRLSFASSSRRRRSNQA